MPDVPTEFSQDEIANMLNAPFVPADGQPQIAPADTPTDLAASVRAYYERQRVELLARISEIEDFLGFVEVAGDLATRVAKLERFTGIGR